MEVGQLRYIIAAAENGSFRRAAEALRVQQSSVSHAIRQLEDELGVSLFERRSTGAHLTDAGRCLLCEARPPLEQLDLARKAAAAAGRIRDGDCDEHIGAIRAQPSHSLGAGADRNHAASTRSYRRRYSAGVMPTWRWKTRRNVSILLKPQEAATCLGRSPASSI